MKKEKYKTIALHHRPDELVGFIADMRKNLEVDIPDSEEGKEETLLAFDDILTILNLFIETTSEIEPPKKAIIRGVSKKNLLS